MMTALRNGALFGAGVVAGIVFTANSYDLFTKARRRLRRG